MAISPISKNYLLENNKSNGERRACRHLSNIFRFVRDIRSDRIRCILESPLERFVCFQPVERITLVRGSSRWYCGSEVHRHGGIVLSQNSCRYSCHTGHRAAHRATSRAPESIAGRGILLTTVGMWGHRTFEMLIFRVFFNYSSS